ncbi:KUP/HAK/KT family potassium transporter [Lactiplantibacillus pentosus]|uniref:KUP/HAK/KT family potassium transporter n=1 Tax=Lactiplantibacillus pentosus TaxID=1589 RepID=UPI003C284059
MSKQTQLSKRRAAGLLVAMGVVYGDIGTSPLYVMKAIVTGQGGLQAVDETFMLGAVSLVFWTMTLLTTVKYVMIALNADNHGEGGIFSLFALVRHRARWLVVPAMIGGAALLADGTLTPAVTVTTAIEGLRDVPAYVQLFGTGQQAIIIITLAIITGLFMLQRFGTNTIGKLFGPIMLAWFTFLGLSGLLNLTHDWTILRALNPYYAGMLLISPANKVGILILGSVFLATTGAEALYSDLGHVGKTNIRLSWPYVKICLLLSYFGQAAWILGPGQARQGNVNPFFAMLPANLTMAAVIFATVAAIIASQSLISGSFTLVSEAIRLKLFPRLFTTYPGNAVGQMYLPAVNWGLWVVTSSLVLFFQTSEKMEAAYGLAITLTMLMTTTLIYAYMRQKRVPILGAGSLTAFFAVIEGIFLVASAAKFWHGGYVAVGLALLIFLVMAIWYRGEQLVKQHSQPLSLSQYKPQLARLRDDQTIDKFQTNVVFLTSRMDGDQLERQVLYSILDKWPKRADVYWFVNVTITDEPYTAEYKVDTLATDYVVMVKLYLGFRVRQDINRYLRTIVRDLMASGRLASQEQTYSVTPGRDVGDFRFVIIEEKLTNSSRLSRLDRWVLETKLAIKKYATTPAKWFGLEFSEVTVETVPILFSEIPALPITEKQS